MRQLLDCLVMLVAILIGTNGAHCQAASGDPFEEFRGRYLILDKYKWSIEYRIQQADEIIISARTTSGDTLLFAEVEKYLDSTARTAFSGRFTRVYMVGDSTIVTAYDHADNPAYSYKYGKDLGERVFIFGEYRYHYFYGMLTAGQRRYYELFSDSLQAVKGSNLPPLPEEN